MLEARELSYYPVEELEENKNTTKKIKRQKKVQKKNTSSLKLLFLFFPVMISAICLLILFRYVNITSVRQEITKLENQKVELEKTKINLIGDLEGIKSSKKIAEDAMLKLGMDYPKPEQIVYISVNENAPTEQEAKSNNRLKRVFSIVGNLF